MVEPRIQYQPPASREATPGDLRSICNRCNTELRRSAYEVRLSGTAAYHCLRCALMHWPMVQRSLFIGLVVGTVLTAINQGNIIAQGDLPANLAWQVPLTYVVPYCVATLGAILNARSTVGVELDGA